MERALLEDSLCAVKPPPESLDVLRRYQPFTSPLGDELRGLFFSENVSFQGSGAIYHPAPGITGAFGVDRPSPNRPRARPLKEIPSGHLRRPCKPGRPLFEDVGSLESLLDERPILRIRPRDPTRGKEFRSTLSHCGNY